MHGLHRTAGEVHIYPTIASKIPNAGLNKPVPVEYPTQAGAGGLPNTKWCWWEPTPSGRKGELGPRIPNIK